MAPSDPRVRAIVNDLLPSADIQWGGLLPCTGYKEAPHFPIVSYGATTAATVGKIFCVCTAPKGSRCSNHLKPTTTQMTDEKFEEMRTRVAALDPPARFGGTVYLSEHPSDHAGTVARPRRSEGAPKRMGMVDCYIYMKEADMPISVPCSSAFTTVIGLKSASASRLPATSSESSLAKGRYPSNISTPFDVVNCPGVVNLAAGRPVEFTPPPLPSLLEHMGGDLDGDEEEIANSPVSPADYLSSGSNDDLAIVYSSPGRVLLTPAASDVPSSPMTSEGSSGPGPSSGPVGGSSRRTLSLGRKRERDDDPITLRKRRKGKERAKEYEEESDGAWEVWEVLDDNIEVLMD
ncbi:uncharacterized protein B0H18DRAFT_1115766 [Fomitopsis serialis]|uniref:uncharacterized protein n=1 Tax=Fomitopsis serialis TaxID=139415 RepID=UPI00200752ED|nr:uncharacterized protein B0H18DRAFT_1115766 [Neoantrodia serialis]KAH9932514.1 hypothetical protein B0H18DRAFT_1115766 [Neoantrodia serialis]